MENERKDAEIGTPDIFAPFSEEKPVFSANIKEIIAALAMYVLAWCYLGSPWPQWLAVFTAGFIALTEYLHWNTRRSAESWIWLGCMAVILASILLPELSISRLLGSAQTERVWDLGISEFFLHLYAVYGVLCRSGRLGGENSSRLLPLDALHGFIIFPFKHFFLRIRSVFFGLKQLSPRKKAVNPGQIVIIIAAVLAAIGLFGLAVDLLGQADSSFFDLTDRFVSFFRIKWDPELLIRFFLSLPIGAYLFGLLAGSAREDSAQLQARGERTLQAFDTIRRVPLGIWIAVLAAFSALYAVFFFLQGSYLFGAFTRTLPEGFIVSEYARQGFFELCKVMAVNFALLWCVTRSASQPARKHSALLIMCVVLLAESMLFAVIAFSKLALYIDCFGFTPLRLQSSWLVCVLFTGCICTLIHLLSNRKTFRFLLIFSGVSLAFLHLF
ncbi:MAG: DUF4173 domain-containing protein [Clostridia bacterium]|nr:DUF4173 domain-containing protein [Clostridia bacterium]